MSSQSVHMVLQRGLCFLLYFGLFKVLAGDFRQLPPGTIATDLIPSNRRGEGMGFYGLSGNMAMAFGPSLGLALVGVITFKQLFFICAGLGLAAYLLASRITFKKAEKVGQLKQTKQTSGTRKFDLFEKSALPPSFLLFFNTVTFGGIATFLPLYTVQKNIEGIQWYFLIYAMALMLSRSFAGQLYDRKGHQSVFIPGTILIMGAMLLLAWLPNSIVLYSAAVLYGLGFGTIQPALQAWSVNQAPMHLERNGKRNLFLLF